MQDPLKQGLKPRGSLEVAAIPMIRMQDPLKQGLKHFHHSRADTAHD